MDMFTIALAALSLSGAPDAASIEAPRRAFDRCLDRVEQQHRGRNGSGDSLLGAINGACAGEEAALKNALVAYDVGTGTSRAEAQRWAADDIADAKTATVRRYRVSSR